MALEGSQEKRPTGSIRLTPQFSVVVDDREESDEILNALRHAAEINLRVARMPVGDYRLEDKVLIERKTIPDFAQSIVDGRLFRQARQLLLQPIPTLIILEGRTSDLKSVGLRREAMQGAMVSLTVRFRLPILRAVDPSETVSLLKYACHQLHEEASWRPYSAGGRPKGKRRQQLRMLQGLPGIGPDRAVRLLDHFGSIEKIVAAAGDDLERVEGIGAKTSHAIRELLSEPQVPYQSIAHSTRQG